VDTTADVYMYAGVRMMNWGDVPTWLQAGSTILLVVITAYYAWQNKRMADHNARMVEEIRRQSRIQQYERRATILRGTLRCLGLVLRDGRVPGEAIPCLLEATSEKEYLLDKSMCDYLRQIYTNCVTAYTYRNQLEGSPANRHALVEAEHKLIAWLTEQPQELRQRFVPYLRLEDERVRS
jgi:ABC-type nickel/cobalt efflux system permease component RcnA